MSRWKLLAPFLLFFSVPLVAATKTWDGSFNGNWASPLNWTPIGAPVAGDVLVFPAGAMNLTMTSFTADFNSITFSGAGYTVNGSGFGLTSGISVTHTSGTTTINVPVTLVQSEIFDVESAAAALVLSDIILGVNLVEFSGAGRTTVGGVISGSGSILKVETGKLTLSGTNTYGGPTLVGGGTVLLQNGAALGSASGVTTVNAGAAVALDGGITVAENVTLNGSGTLGEGALVGVGGTNTWTGNVILGTAPTIGATSGDITISGVVSGVNALTTSSIQPRAVTLAGANTYTGTTTVSQGTLRIASVTALGATSAGTTVVAGATLEILAPLTPAAEPLTLNGAGVGNIGALILDSGGDSTWAGTISLATTSRISVNLGLELTVNGVISGVGASGLFKLGTGTLVLTAANTYTGTTTVSAGVLQVDGVQPGSAVSVNGTAHLAGTGTVGDGTIFGSVHPGTSPGILGIGNVTFAAQADYFVELNGPTPGSCGACYDQLAVTGTVDLGGSTLNLAYNGFGTTPGQTFTIVSNDSSEGVAGTFGGLPNLAYLVSNGAEFQITYAGVFINDVILTAVAPPFASISPGSMASCGAVNQLLTATPAGGNGDYTSYQWYRNGFSLGAGATASTYTATQSGSYTVTVTDSFNITGPQSAPTVLGDTAAPTVTSPTAVTVTQTTCS